jgi:hypothetical protein
VNARPFYAAALALVTAGCGYIGDPLPPSLSIPERITDLRAFERESSLVIDFTAPASSTDGVLFERLEAIEVAIGPEVANWEQHAARIEAEVEPRPGPVHVEIPVADWVGKEVIVAARAVSRKGRPGEWSNLVRLSVVAPLDPPAEVRARETAKGVELKWREARPGAVYRVYRREQGAGEPQLVADRVPDAAYLDAGAAFGRTYHYAVQVLLPAGDADAVSAPSDPVPITPVDRFPPGVPTGLQAIPSVASIELRWNPNPEPDLSGYRLHRSVGGGPFEAVSDLLPTPSYSDRAIEAGKRYRYAISSVDQSGNVSMRSEPVEVVAPS